MRLLNMTKTDAATYGSPITLDDLWENACKLGRVSVDHNFASGQYVEIRFKRATGSTVFARGEHSEIREAFRLAIEEAISMGAKP